MKHFTLLFALTLLLNQLAIVQAEDPADLFKATELMAQLKENPNDAKVMVAFGNANFGEAMSLAETDPDSANKYLDAIDAFYDSLEPEDAEAKLWKTKSIDFIKSLKQRIKIARIPIEELKERLAKDPDDTEAISFYIQKVLPELFSEARANPKVTEANLAKFEEYLKSISEKSERDATKTAIALATRNFSQLKEMIEKQYKILAVIGKDTIPLGINQWTNGVPISDAELKGKVVLLDFWAMWCGPCVATFPHLVEWNKEYADDGLVILGLTRFYNYRWDDITKTAVQSQTLVEPADELVVLEKFAQLHNLEHRIGVQPRDSRLSDHFAVFNIPHMVLIDRQGKVRMIKVVVGESIANELEAKIKELLAE